MARGDRKQGGPESQHGSPAYDATIHPANAAAQAVISDRFQEQVGLHLFGNKSAAALAFSHFYESVPSPTVVALMGLGAQRDVMVQAQDRRWEHPFPGVPLGPTPSFHAAPDTNPIVGGSAAGRTHHAHQFETRRASRARFKR